MSEESPFQKAENLKPSKPPTTYKPSSSANGDVDHGKRQHELQLNFKVKIANKTPHKPMKLDPTTLQDKIAINEEAVLEDQAKIFEQASVPELKNLLKERGLPTAGKKGDLVARLILPPNRQRITPLSLDEDRAPSPTGSPKLKGGAHSPRYAPYSGSLSPRFQDHLSPRLVSNLSLNSPLEDDDSDGRQSEQGFVGTPLGRTSGALYAQSPDLGSPVEGRPRAHSIEPQAPKGRRMMSSESQDSMMKKVMGRSSSTSVLPVMKTTKSRSELAEGDLNGPKMPRAQSSELYPTSTLHGYHGGSFPLGSIDETHMESAALESASSLFYHNTKKQYALQVSTQGSFSQNSYDLLGRPPASQDFAPHLHQPLQHPSQQPHLQQQPPLQQHHQLTSYSGIAESQYLVEELHSEDDLRMGIELGGTYLSSPEVLAAQNPSAYPMFQSHDPYAADMRTGYETQAAFVDETFYTEEPGYIMKKEAVDFQLPSHGQKYPTQGLTMPYNEYYVDSTQHSFDQRGAS